eukprot:Hpha_TRINITY_DN358_c0_g1::TRINITY_DN358_c0_g1_i1::g.112663::m.112663/K05841/E2.4.1.173; sterol 3beta-glucosyltransferase
MGGACCKKADNVFPDQDHQDIMSNRTSGSVEYVWICIERARGLPAVDHNYHKDPSSDPYVRVNMGNHELTRTPVVYNTLEPEWDFGHGFWLHPSTPSQCTMDVWDWNLVAKDVRLGSVSFDVLNLIEGLIEGGDAKKQTFQLTRPSGETQGEIDVAIAKRAPPHANHGEGGLGLLVGRALNVPRVDMITGESDTYVKVEVVGKEGCGGRTPVRWQQAHPVWNDCIYLGASGSTYDTSAWDLDKTLIRLSMYDTDRVQVTEKMDKFIGEATITVRDLIKRPSTMLLMSTKEGAPVLGSKPPHLPCELDVAVLQDTIPASWPAPTERNYSAEDYPKHVFMMTRGTRGDVQPFVALARGMATMLGWMVTICTELKWKDFVIKNADVPRGKIRFRPSGGDTDKRVQKASAQWAMNSKGEMMQSLMLAFAEAEFFDSGPVFVHHLLRMQVSKTPADLIVFSFTTAGVAMLASERCNVPCAGFILQPSCIPSRDESWKAVVAIDSHSFEMIDRLEENYFTSHDTLEKLKSLAESGWVGSHSLRGMRKDFGLRPAPTWRTIRRQDLPLIVPMAPGTFRRPDDWGRRTQFTDFIFLRRKTGPGATALGEPADSFVDRVKASGKKLIVMTFSSMPVKRQKMLKIAISILKECKYPCAVMYVGAKQQDTPPAALQKDAEALAAEGRLLELTAVDFGLLFTMADAFIVHGGLGTTVEALRTGKPVAVTGPLLMDQRFWGQVCHDKGVGPPPVHVDDFDNICVDFANNALDPGDPESWQLSGQKQQGMWGKADTDGVEQNVVAFRALLEQGRCAGCCAVDTSAIPDETPQHPPLQGSPASPVAPGQPAQSAELDLANGRALLNQPEKPEKPEGSPQDKGSPQPEKAA